MVVLWAQIGREIYDLFELLRSRTLNSVGRENYDLRAQFPTNFANWYVCVTLGVKTCVPPAQNGWRYQNPEPIQAMLDTLGRKSHFVLIFRQSRCSAMCLVHLDIARDIGFRSDLIAPLNGACKVVK